MANIRLIRRRIRSVQNTAKITKAMELVAASKMRRAQQRALAARPYAERLRWVLADLAESLHGLAEPITHPLLERREVRTVLVVHVTPDRGLCGGLSANLNRRTLAFLLEQAEQGRRTRVVAVGRKGRDFLRRLHQELVAEFTRLGDYPAYEDTRPISRVILDEFLSGDADQVFVVHPRFINTATQRPEILPLLPVEAPVERETQAYDYIYEPSRQAVLEALLPRYVEMELYAAILELAASEQSARMVAMRNATENAKEMVQDLTLTYNKARQEQITKELLDIAGGAAALVRA